MKVLLVLFVLSAQLLAQRKVWEWSPSAETPLHVHAVHAVHAITIEAKGGAAIVIGERVDTEQSYRLFWLSNKGEVRHEVVIPASPESLDVLLAAAPTKWKILSLSPTRWAVTNGATVWFASKRGGNIISSSKDLGNGVEAIQAARPGQFDGWIERARTPNGAYVWEGHPDQQTFRINSVALWSPR